MSENKYRLFGEYMVVQIAQKPWECFVMFDHDHTPLFSTDMREGMIFAYKEAAEMVAGRLGKEWRVIDVSQKEVEKAKRLLDALFREDEDDEEWADGIGQTFSPD